MAAVGIIADHEHEHEQGQLPFESQNEYAPAA